MLTIRSRSGALNDRSGLYADIGGEGSVIAAKMAIEEFNAAEKGHQSRGCLGRPSE
jgi:branched-chain amino acid transport system substrate-binding protein